MLEGRAPRYGYLALILVGVCLRAWQFLADTSLYIDEIALAYDVVRTSALDLLLYPLHEQIAPKGFLLASKAIVGLFGPSDMALRSIAFASSAASVVVFWRLATKLRGWAGPLALALFAMAPPLILFSSEVKPYSCDVLATVLLLLMTVQVADDKSMRAPQRTVYALTGAATVWFSHAAILVAASQVGALLWLRHRRSQTQAQATPILLAWIASAAAAAVVSALSVNAEMQPYLEQYWAAGFPPTPFSCIATLQWIGDRIASPLRDGNAAGLALPLSGVAVVLVMFGFVALWRRKRSLSICLLAPVVVALSAAAIHRYPFADRLVLFLLPIVCIALAVGIDVLRELIFHYSKTAALFVYLLFAGAFLSTLFSARPPYHVEDMKPVLEYLEARRQPADRIYAYYAAAPALLWYGNRYGLEENAYAVGGCHRGYPQAYLRELNQYRGNPRVWVLIAHARTDLAEREYLLAYLDSIGVRREQFVVEAHIPNTYPSPAAAYLYDLSQAPAVPAGTEDSAEIATLSCLHGPHVMVAKRGLP